MKTQIQISSLLMFGLTFSCGRFQTLPVDPSTGLKVQQQAPQVPQGKAPFRSAPSPSEPTGPIKPPVTASEVEENKEVVSEQPATGKTQKRAEFAGEHADLDAPAPVRAEPATGKTQKRAEFAGEHADLDSPAPVRAEPAQLPKRAEFYGEQPEVNEQAAPLVEEITEPKVVSAETKNSGEETKVQASQPKKKLGRVRPGRPAKKATPVVDESREQMATEDKTEVKPLAASEIGEQGTIRPTIYFFPVYDEDANNCSSSDKVEFHDKSGNVLMKVCKRTHEQCGLQGSCAIKLNGATRSYNIWNRISGQDRFFEITSSCRFGYGVQQMCLDPFYTLAADLSIYTPGDVVYIPSLVGVVLPNGSKHNGLFVIRDRGRGVTGKGRFDFFTGYFGWRNSENPFTKLGLGDKNTDLKYYILKGPRAQGFLDSRGFPKLGTHTVTTRPETM